MAFDNSKPRTAELTVQNQVVCAEWYANARNAKTPAEARYWQDGAAYHFVKTSHRMNILQPMLESCAYWHARCKG